MARLYAATGNSIVRLDEADGGWITESFLEGTGAQCLAVDPHDPDTVFAGLREGGVRRTQDGGRSWVDCALPEAGVFSLAVGAADGAVYAGTEPSRLFRSDDGGESWRELEALLQLPSRPTWSFPPRPWTSHVRWIAPSPHNADLLLVGIELGGLMRSTDGGETWQPADEGRDRHYAWSVAVDHDDPDLWFVSVSTGPFAAHGRRRRDPQARIYRRRGREWSALDGGLPEPLPAMPYALVATEGRLFAGFADGRIWESSDRGDTWTECALAGDA